MPIHGNVKAEKVLECFLGSFCLGLRVLSWCPEEVSIGYRGLLVCVLPLVKSFGESSMTTAHMEKV